MVKASIASFDLFAGLLLSSTLDETLEQLKIVAPKLTWRDVEVGCDSICDFLFLPVE